MTDEEERQQLLEQLAAMTKCPGAIRRFCAKSSAGQLASYIEQIRRGKAANAALGGSPIGMHWQARV